MDNLEEMDKVLEKFSLPRLKQEAIEIMNNLITNTEIEAVIKNSQKTKAQDQMASQEKSIKHFISVQFSHSVVSDSLPPHESQHARPPCPSPTPRVHSDSRPSSQ